MAIDDTLLDRITWNPEILAGKPIIRGRRVAVEHVLEMLAAGMTHGEILEEFEFMEAEDIRACLTYAYRHVSGWSIYEYGFMRT